MKLKTLFETPQLIELDPLEIKNGIKICLANVNTAKVIEKFDNHVALYQLMVSGLGYYFIYDDSQHIQDRVEYFVRYRELEFDKTLLPTKTIRQVMLWRHTTSFWSAGAAQKIFWDILFQKYKCLASDSQQSADGKKFWSTAVGIALGKGLVVRIINTNDKTFIDVKTKSEFAEKIPTTWGTGSWFQRMIVTIFEEPSKKV